MDWNNGISIRHFKKIRIMKCHSLCPVIHMNDEILEYRTSYQAINLCSYQLFEVEVIFFQDQKVIRLGRKTCHFHDSIACNECINLATEIGPHDRYPFIVGNL